MSSEVQSELLCPATSSSFLPLVVKTLAVPDDLTYIACQGEEDWDPAYIIHLYPTVTIRNLLPYSIQYLLEVRLHSTYSIQYLLEVRLYSTSYSTY